MGEGTGVVHLADGGPGNVESRTGQLAPCPQKWVGIGQPSFGPLAHRFLRLQAGLCTQNLKSELLSLGCDLAATEQIEIPNKRGSVHSLDANFTFFARTHFARPHHAVLDAVVANLHIQKFARQNLASQAMNLCARRAEILDGGGLSKGQGMSVHAPQAYRDESFDSWMAATIHAGILRQVSQIEHLRQLSNMVPEVTR